MFEFNSVLHVGFGSLAFLGGIVAFVAEKGSTWHIRGGQLFAVMIGLVILTTVVQMFHEFLPLAIAAIVIAFVYRNYPIEFPESG